jgi:hypothetical protein
MKSVTHLWQGLGALRLANVPYVSFQKSKAINAQ